jgi:hypothetical protein
MGDFMGQASPEVQGAYASANQAYPALATMRDAASQQALKQNVSIGSQDGGVFNRMVTSIPGMDRLPDTMGNMAQLASDGLGAVGGAADWASRSVSGLGSGLAGLVLGPPSASSQPDAAPQMNTETFQTQGQPAWLTDAGGGDPVQRYDASKPGIKAAGNGSLTPAQQQSGDAGRSSTQQQFDEFAGQDLYKRADKLLDEDPDAFAPWENEIRENADDERFGALVERLARTDARFRADVLPKIRGQR